MRTLNDSAGQAIATAARRLVFLICAAGLIAGYVGCGKKNSERSSTPPTPAPTSPAVPAENAAVPTPPPPPPPPPTDGAPPEAPPAAAVADGDFTVSPALRAVLTKFFNDYQHPATSWKELIDLHYISSIPRDSNGKPMEWQKFMDAVAKSSGR